MNKAAESCKIVIDDDGRIAKLIAGKLKWRKQIRRILPLWAF